MLDRTKTIFKLSSAAITVVVLLSPCSFAASNWMNDWITSSTSSGPSYFNGQARGYLSGGSFSARWPVSQNSNPISVTPPKLSAGCGGISYYGGSVSFLQPQMLVKKMQGILQNSAGVAFQMALDTLCSKCVTIMNAMEDISDKLNSMALDDCKAAKGVVTTFRPAMEQMGEGFREGEFADAMEQGLTTGYQDMLEALPSGATAFDVNKWVNAQKGQAQSTVASVSGCPADIATLFPRDSGAYPVSVLQVVGGQMGLPAAYTDMLRGMVGDLKIDSPVTTGAGVISYIDPCSNNTPQKLSLTDLQTGNFQSKNFPVEGCYKETTPNSSMQDYVFGKLQSISTSLSSNTSLQAADIDFITHMPIPMLYGLRMAIATGQQGNLTPNLAGIGSAALSMNAIKDLLARYEEVLSYMRQASFGLSRRSGDCDLSGYYEMTGDGITKMRNNIADIYKLMSADYQVKMQEFTTSFTLNNQLQQLNSQLQQQVAMTFGHSVAQRAMRGL